MRFAIELNFERFTQGHSLTDERLQNPFSRRTRTQCRLKPSWREFGPTITWMSRSVNTALLASSYISGFSYALRPLRMHLADVLILILVLFSLHLLQRFPRIQYSITSPRAFSDTASRATSTSMLPFRFSSQPHGLQSLKRQGESKSSDFFSGGMIRRSSISSKPNDKGKEPVIGEDAVDSPVSGSALFGTCIIHATIASCAYSDPV